LFLGSLAAGQDSDVSPASLLAEAHRVAQTLPPRADWANSLVLLRVADTMRLAGLRSEALVALDDCRRSNATVSVEAIRDETTIELCRLLVLLGERDQAESAAATATFRNYALPARYLIARTAAETDAAAAEAVLRHASFLKPHPDEKGSGDLWRRAGVRIAVQIGQLDLARQLIEVMISAAWKSAALGDVAVARAQAGRRADALKTASEAPDAYLAVIGLARVAEALARGKPAEPLDAALDALRRAADQVPTAPERDYALGVAVRRLAAAGRLDAAAALAEAIQEPCVRVRAQSGLLTPDRLPKIREAVAACPEAEQPLLAECLAISCARQGLAPAALSETERIADPWQRCRAQSTAVRALADSGRQAEATALAQAAAASAAAVTLPPWRVRAHVRLALDAERAGLSELADQQLASVRDTLPQVTDPSLQPGLVVGVAEALTAMKRRAMLREFAAEVLQADASAATRNRLLPLLASAGETAMVVAECARARPSDSLSLRAIIYRLAQQGSLADARACAEPLSGINRAEALADIALAQLRPVAPPPATERAVGVSLHGSWGSWFLRLERMGVAWELMPFSEPYELGAASLAVKYSALGYPGTGGHISHVAVAGAENLRDYLYAGGGLLGICAGQYLATGQRYVECDSIGMPCPSCPHQVQMRKLHLVALGLPEVVTISRRNGGMLIPRPGCELLGWYDTIERYAALVAQDYGYGRVVAFSPHPEGGGGLDPRDRLCINALSWTIGGLP